MLTRIIVLAAFVALGTVVVRDITITLTHAERTVVSEVEGTQPSFFPQAIVSVPVRV